MTSSHFRPKISLIKCNIPLMLIILPSIRSWILLLANSASLSYIDSSEHEVWSANRTVLPCKSHLQSHLDFWMLCSQLIASRYVLISFQDIEDFPNGWPIIRLGLQTLVNQLTDCFRTIFRHFQVSAHNASWIIVYCKRHMQRLYHRDVLYSSLLPKLGEKVSIEAVVALRRV